MTISALGAASVFTGFDTQPVSRASNGHVGQASAPSVVSEARVRRSADGQPFYEKTLIATEDQCKDLGSAYLKTLLPWKKAKHKKKLQKAGMEIIVSQAAKIFDLKLNTLFHDIKRVEIKIHALGVKELTQKLATWVDKELVAQYLGVKPELLTIEGAGGRPKDGLVDMTIKLYK
jgi:hypothetical protein